MRHQVAKQKKIADYHEQNLQLTAELKESYQTNACITCQLEQAYHDIHDLKIMLRELSNDMSELLNASNKDKRESTSSCKLSNTGGN